MAVDNLKADDLVVGAPAKAKRQRRRKPSLIGVAKQAAKAGIKVARYEVNPDGKIIVTGKPDVATIDANINANEWN